MELPNALKLMQMMLVWSIEISLKAQEMQLTLDRITGMKVHGPILMQNGLNSLIGSLMPMGWRIQLEGIMVNTQLSGM